MSRLDAIQDRDIDYSDIPALDDTFYTKALTDWPPPKKQLTIRLDEDVLDWLKAPGKGYQSRINRILRAAMDAHKKKLDA
ncbi:BrnA antitoxin family protein [Marinivivus vitaminiproducens]|uniref:BrnA antitoxin family protein n=1 Tax=Marinivivus vitaminiproducens TaxID=3035935 RepID=UPI00279CCDAA|nr:BrnA antitoxin family protein [Geminicoccaceae bacterium SCSIO 64248]